MEAAKALWRRSMRQTTSETSNPSLEEAVVTVAIVGAGQRGTAYARFALRHPELCKIVAVAEPRPKTRRIMVDAHRIDRTLVFEDWHALLAASKETAAALNGKRLADAVVVAVQDSLHREVVEAFASEGYHILCEKPIATSAEDCLRMHDAVKKAGVIFGTGHVLRYSPYNRDIAEIIQSGSIGQLVNVVHVEPVGYQHFAHSYVRGNWAREKDSSFVLMTKCCHDLDIISSWFAPLEVARVSSFGSLMHFRKSEKPSAAGTAKRCMECPIERECEYSAKRIYLDAVMRGNDGWPLSTIVDGIPDIENITEALKSGPYGRCVYESDNDVCDNQVVNLEFTNGATASFTMAAHSLLVCERQTRMHFSHGEIVGDSSCFQLTDFRQHKTSKQVPRYEGGGHGGGDSGLMGSFVDAVRTGEQARLGTDVDEILRSHMLVFAAETSRLEGRVVDCAEFVKAERAKLGLPG